MSTTRQWWRLTYRHLRVARREATQSAIDASIYGTGCVYISPEGSPTRIPFRWIPGGLTSFGRIHAVENDSDSDSHMTKPKGKDKGDIPEKEWLTQEGHALHQAEKLAGGYTRRRKLLWVVAGLGLLGLGILVVFYLVNRP